MIAVPGFTKTPANLWSEHLRTDLVRGRTLQDCGTLVLRNGETPLSQASGAKAKIRLSDFLRHHHLPQCFAGDSPGGCPVSPADVFSLSPYAQPCAFFPPTHPR